MRGKEIFETRHLQRQFPKRDLFSNRAKAVSKQRILITKTLESIIHNYQRTINKQKIKVIELVFISPKNNHKLRTIVFVTEIGMYESSSFRKFFFKRFSVKSKYRF